MSSIGAILATASQTVRDITFRMRIDQCDAKLLADEDMDLGTLQLEDARGRLKNLESVTFEFDKSAPNDYLK